MEQLHPVVTGQVLPAARDEEEPDVASCLTSGGSAVGPTQAYTQVQSLGLIQSPLEIVDVQMMASWLVGWLVGWLVYWLSGWLLVG